MSDAPKRIWASLIDPELDNGSFCAPRPHMNGGPPNGDAILYHHADTVKALTAERDALREALTASGSTKADYMGEFRIDFPLFDENGEEYIQPVNVPWTTIKEIMAAILNRALPTPPKETP